MRKDGFTLFEVLITLAILAVVLSLLYQTFHQSMMVMAETEDRAEIIRQGRLILERMTEEIKESYIPLQENRTKSFNFGMVSRSLKEDDEFLDKIDFTTLSHPPKDPAVDKGDISEIGYFLEHEPGGKGLTLFRRQDEAIDGDLLKGGDSLAICDRVRSLSLFFFDRRGQKQKEWNSLEGVNRNQLPSRVEIQLKLEDSHSQFHVFRTQVYLPLAGLKG